MKLLVDGKLIKVDNDAKIIYDNLMVTTEDGGEVAAELHVTVTHEGVIEDVWVDDECISTNSLTAQEIVENMCEE